MVSTTVLFAFNDSRLTVPVPGASQMKRSIVNLHCDQDPQPKYGNHQSADAEICFDTYCTYEIVAPRNEKNCVRGQIKNKAALPCRDADTYAWQVH